MEHLSSLVAQLDSEIRAGKQQQTRTDSVWPGSDFLPTDSGQMPGSEFSPADLGPSEFSPADLGLSEFSPADSGPPQLLPADSGPPQLLPTDSGTQFLPSPRSVSSSRGTSSGKPRSKTPGRGRSKSSGRQGRTRGRSPKRRPRSVGRTRGEDRLAELAQANPHKAIDTPSSPRASSPRLASSDMVEQQRQSDRRLAVPIQRQEFDHKKQVRELEEQILNLEDEVKAKESRLSGMEWSDRNLNSAFTELTSRYQDLRQNYQRRSALYKEILATLTSKIPKGSSLYYLSIFLISSIYFLISNRQQKITYHDIENLIESLLPEGEQSQSRGEQGILSSESRTSLQQEYLNIIQVNSSLVERSAQGQGLDIDLDIGNFEQTFDIVSDFIDQTESVSLDTGARARRLAGVTIESSPPITPDLLFIISILKILIIQ